MVMHSAQNKNRLSSVNVERIASILAVLGLVGKDARRLAQRITEGSNGLSPANYIKLLERACRFTLHNDLPVLFRVVNTDLTIYGPKGYAIVDFIPGWVDFAYTYGQGQSFETMTYLYRDVPLNIEQDEQDQLSCYDDTDHTYYYFAHLAREAATSAAE